MRYSLFIAYDQTLKCDFCSYETDYNDWKATKSSAALNKLNNGIIDILVADLVCPICSYAVTFNG